MARHLAGIQAGTERPIAVAEDCNLEDNDLGVVAAGLAVVVADILVDVGRLVKVAEDSQNFHGCPPAHEEGRFQ